MIPEESESEGPREPPLLSYLAPARKEPAFGKYIFYITFAITFLFFLASIALTINPTWSSELSSSFPPYFFVLLLPVVLPRVQVLPLLILMFAIYLILFSYMMYSSSKGKEKHILDTPTGYYAATSSAMLLLITIITLIETFLNTPIGGSGVDQGFQQAPFQTYFQVIYAPFAEEIGFRIIPLGILTFFLVYMKSYNFKDSLISIAIPGIIRKKYNMHFTAYDWTLIIITSAIFGYAHIYFGAWDWGKFVPTFITGIVLAIGFLKFGLYVDIPMHWFFNGFLTLYVLEPSLLIASGVAILWIYFAGIVGLIFIILYARSYYSGKKESVPAV